jgi:hypothetical protein
MGCVKLHILDEQYKQTELKVSYSNKELTSNFCTENPRRATLLIYIDPDGRDVYTVDITTGEITLINNLGTNVDIFNIVTPHENDIEGLINTYIFEKNEHGLIDMQNNQYGINTHGESGIFMSPLATGAMLGVIELTGFDDISIGNFSRQDGTSPQPSTSHRGGNVGDLRPLRTDQAGTPVTVDNIAFDRQRNTNLVSALGRFGWTNVLSERDNTGYITPGTNHFSGYTDRQTGEWRNSRHNNHFHLQGFRPNFINKTQNR